MGSPQAREEGARKKQLVKVCVCAVWGRLHGRWWVHGITTGQGGARPQEAAGQSVCVCAQVCVCECMHVCDWGRLYACACVYVGVFSVWGVGGWVGGCGGVGLGGWECGCVWVGGC